MQRWQNEDAIQQVSNSLEKHGMVFMAYIDLLMFIISADCQLWGNCVR